MTSSSTNLGTSAQECYDRGVRLLQSGEIADAILQFQQAVFFDGENANPLAALAECHVFLCDLPSAVRYYRRAMWVLTRRRRAQQREYEREHGPMLFLVGQQATTNALYCVTPPSTPSLTVTAGTSASTGGALGAGTPTETAATGQDCIRVPNPGANGRTKAGDFNDDSGVPLQAVQRRLAALLDALGLALFRLAHYEQALRFSLEALDVLGEKADMRVTERPTSGTSSHSCEDALPSSPKPPRPGEAASAAAGRRFAPTVQLHRCTYLIALQRTEDAEYALESFLDRYPEQQAEAGALLVQLYCNRQAFSLARKMVEKLEGACTSVSARQQSLKIAQHIFNKQYMRYRTKALERRDLGTISKCIDVYPNDVDLLFTRANLFIERGEHKRSVKDLFQCVRETNGQHRGAVDAMTSVLFSLGSELGEGGESSLEEAIAYYTESLKWRPDNPLVILARADCYVKLEDYQQALAGYRKLLEMNPDDAEAAQRIAFLHDRWGRKLHTQGKVREAEQEFTMAIKSSDQEPLFYYHRALCRFALGESRYGLRDVLSCQQLQPTDPRIRAFIVRYLGSADTPETTLSSKEAEARALLYFNEEGNAALAQRGPGVKNFTVSAARAAALYGQPSARLREALEQGEATADMPTLRGGVRHDGLPRRAQPPSTASAASAGTNKTSARQRAADKRTTAHSLPPPTKLRTYQDLVIAQHQPDGDPHAAVRGKSSDELRFKFATSDAQPRSVSGTPFAMVQGARTGLHARELPALPPTSKSARQRTGTHHTISQPH